MMPQAKYILVPLILTLIVNRKEYFLQKNSNLFLSLDLNHKVVVGNRIPRTPKMFTISNSGNYSGPHRFFEHASSEPPCGGQEPTSSITRACPEDRPHKNVRICFCHQKQSFIFLLSSELKWYSFLEKDSIFDVIIN